MISWKLGLRVQSVIGRRLNNVTGLKSRFVGYADGSVCDVENLVIQDLFESGGWVGWHSEGAPVRTVFSLLMWDILFAPHPDVFQTPFQVTNNGNMRDMGSTGGVLIRLVCVAGRSAGPRLSSFILHQPGAYD